jgi:hypothetical protein
MPTHLTLLNLITLTIFIADLVTARKRSPLVHWIVCSNTAQGTADCPWSLCIVLSSVGRGLATS